MFYTSVRKLGNKILHRFVDSRGVRQIDRVDYEPTLYIRSNKETGWQTLKKIPVEPRRYSSMSEAREFVEQMKDIKPDIVHGSTDFDMSFIHETYYREEMNFDFSKIKTFFLDIEVEAYNGFPKPEEALDPINAITVYDTEKQKYYTFSTVAEHFRQKFTNTLYVPCSDERQLITAFVNFWSRDYPDIVSGWNSNNFDIPYLINRITRLYGEDFARNLSPWKKITARTGKNSYGQDAIIYDIFGIELLDYLDLYKKFTIKNQESYRLGFIAELEIGEGKVEFDGNLNDLAKDDPDLFLKYNQYDVYLLVKMEAKLQLLYLCATVAYLMRCNYSDALGTVRPWTSLVAFTLQKKNMVIDHYHRPFEDQTFEAAYVKEPIKGKYQTVVTLDATAMYPSMIMGFNISPEMKVEYADCPDELKPYFLRRQIEIIEEDKFELTHLLQKYNLCMAGNGQLYRKDGIGILPEIVNMLQTKRKEKKKQMLSLKSDKEQNKNNAAFDIEAIEALIRSLDVMQNSLKVAGNSGFGAVGNKHFPLFDLDSAEAITLSGQAGIRFVSKRISQYITNLLGLKEFKDFVIYIDTDSLAINLSLVMDKFGLDKNNVDLIQKIADSKLQDVASAACKEFADMTNMMWQSLIFKREKICTAGVYIKKKKYFLYVHDSEGVRYAKPELAITGLETNRSSTPQFVRDKLTDALYIIIQKDENALHEFVQDFREEFMTKDLYTIAAPRTANDMEKYANKHTIYGPRCPIAVRASLLYNHYIKAKGLDKKYQTIKSGEKVKYVHLSMPNPIRENVIGFTDKFPTELGLEQFLDYDMMFEKTFLDPLKNICDAIGWYPEKISNLNSFFM